MWVHTNCESNFRSKVEKAMEGFKGIEENEAWKSIHVAQTCWDKTREFNKMFNARIDSDAILEEQITTKVLRKLERKA